MKPAPLNNQFISNNEFELDSDGYPTPETLELIKTWPPNKESYLDLMRGIKSIWAHAENGYWTYTHKKNHTYNLSTAGWSGNEDIIDALQANKVFWACCWESSRRGGHYVFEV